MKIGDKIILNDDGVFIGTIKHITDSKLTPGEKLLHGIHERNGLTIGSFMNVKMSEAIKYKPNKL